MYEGETILRVGREPAGSGALTTDHASRNAEPISTWEPVDRVLADDETVWVDLLGAGDVRLVGTDRRLLVFAGSKMTASWPWEDVADVAPVWRRHAIRVGRADASDTLTIELRDTDPDTLQAITVLALLAVDASRYGARIDALLKRAGG